MGTCTDNRMRMLPTHLTPDPFQYTVLYGIGLLNDYYMIIICGWYHRQSNRIQVHSSEIINEWLAPFPRGQRKVNGNLKNPGYPPQYLFEWPMLSVVVWKGV